MMTVTDTYRRRMGWTFPWYSSFGSDFNYDFHVTHDEAVAPVEYNYLDLAPFGRQEDWEEPSGRSDGPFMHWVRRHDRYDAEVAAPDAASPGTDSCCGSAAHRAYSSPEGEMP
jgi:predicted dithiol-disulfide oxidoreductase (DUF899 family)